MDPIRLVKAAGSSAYALAHNMVSKQKVEINTIEKAKDKYAAEFLEEIEALRETISKVAGVNTVAGAQTICKCVVHICFMYWIAEATTNNEMLHQMQELHVEFTTHFPSLIGYFECEGVEGRLRNTNVNIIDHFGKYTVDTCLLKAMMLYIISAIAFNRGLTIIETIRMQLEYICRYTRGVDPAIRHNVVFHLYAAACLLESVGGMQYVENSDLIRGKFNINGTGVGDITRSIRVSDASLNVVVQSMSNDVLVEIFKVDFKKEYASAIKSITPSKTWEYTVCGGLVVLLASATFMLYRYNSSIGQHLDDDYQSLAVLSHYLDKEEIALVKQFPEIIKEYREKLKWGEYTVYFMKYNHYLTFGVVLVGVGAILAGFIPTVLAVGAAASGSTEISSFINEARDATKVLMENVGEIVRQRRLYNTIGSCVIGCILLLLGFAVHAARREKKSKVPDPKTRIAVPQNARFGKLFNKNVACTHVNMTNVIDDNMKVIDRILDNCIG